MLGRRTFLGALFAAILAHPAAAAPATDEGAGRLLQTFQMYLGNAEGLTVKPDGEAYLVSFDLDAALKPFEGTSFKIDPAVVTTHIAEQADGTYHVSDLKVPPLVITVDTNKISYVFDGVGFDGIFDPKIGGFSKAETKFGKVGYEQVTPASAVHVTESDVVGQQTGTPTGAGIATVQQHFTFGGITETVSDPSNPNQKIDVAFGNTSGDVNFVSLRNQAIWDLWAFFVAHPGQEKIVADAGTLKSQLTALLPVFDKLDETVKMTDMSVGTPLGKFSLGEIGFKIVTTGAVEQGSYAFSFSGAKPGYPTGMLQPWQVGLLPTDFSIGADITGLNLDAAARQFITDLDPATKELVPPATMAKAADAMWAGGPLKVTFAPSHINALTYQIEMSGDATVNRSGPPALHVVVKAKGVDATMDSLSTAKQTDPNAGQAVVLLATAKGLGKANPDGTMEWDIELGADGVPTVNGAKLGSK